MDFIDGCIAGKYRLDQIYDYIDLWHEEDSDLDLHEYLGMTWNEYCLWSGKDDVLETIINNRKILV